MAFFKGHPELRHLPETYLGKDALSKKLVKVQEQRVLEKFPALKEQVCARSELHWTRPVPGYLSGP